jgi:hypothetical protein
MAKNIITGIDDDLRQEIPLDIVLPVQYNIIGEKRQNGKTNLFNINTPQTAPYQYGHSVVDTINGAIADGRIVVGNGTSVSTNASTLIYDVETNILTFTSNTGVTTPHTLSTVLNLASSDLTQESENRTYDANTFGLLFQNASLFRADATNVTFNSTNDITSTATSTNRVNGATVLIGASNEIVLNSTTGHYDYEELPVDLDTNNSVQSLVVNSANGRTERRSLTPTQTTRYSADFTSSAWTNGFLILASTHGLPVATNYQITVRNQAGGKVEVTETVSASGHVNLVLLTGVAAFYGNVLISY